MDDLKQIKKQYGEKFSHFCRELFPTILEDKGTLYDLISSNFSPTKSLLKDLEGKEGEFKDFIYDLYDEKRIKDKNPDIFDKISTPEEIMRLAGYILYPECETEADIQSFRHYYYRKDADNRQEYTPGLMPEYRQGEEICTFNGGRLNSCRVWFAVKENIDEIRREDYPAEKDKGFDEKKDEYAQRIYGKNYDELTGVEQNNCIRQNEYGTSIISIQFSKLGRATLSIKNRYNHSVAFPDNTFNNDLDKITPHLTEAFVQTFDINMDPSTQKFSLDNYVLANDGRRYRSNNEINGIHFCENNVIVDGGEVKKYDPERYIVTDCGQIIDLKEKIVFNYEGINNFDSFSSTIPTARKMTVTKDKDGTRTLIISPENKEVKPITMTFNAQNCITSVEDSNLTSAPHFYLSEAKNLQSFSAENLQVLSSGSLMRVKSLRTFNAPKLERLEHSTLTYATNLESFNAPLLTEMEGLNLSVAPKLHDLYLPNLSHMRNECLKHVPFLKTFNAPKLQSIGDDCLTEVHSLKELNIESVRQIGKSCLQKATLLEKFYAPELILMGNNCLQYSENLREFSANNLKFMENDCFSGEKLEILQAQSLQEMGSYCFKNSAVRDVNLPELLYMNSFCFTQPFKLETFRAPKLEEIGSNCFKYTDELKEFHAPNLARMGECCFENSGLESLTLNNIKELRSCCFMFTPKLREINAEGLERIGVSCFYITKELETLNTPSLTRVDGISTGTFQHAPRLNSIKVGDEKIEELIESKIMSARELDIQIVTDPLEAEVKNNKEGFYQEQDVLTYAEQDRLMPSPTEYLESTINQEE